jgi:hypothetical protein
MQGERLQGMQGESHLRARAAARDLFLSNMLQGMQGESLPRANDRFLSKRLQGMQGESLLRALFFSQEAAG